MHIVLGALGSIVTILWLLHRLARMGIDLGGLNPWLWRRRRRWRKTLERNPIFTLEAPMDVAALLITATAKLDGDMSGEEKEEILKIFSEEFGLSGRDAGGLLVSSSYLFGKGDEIREKLHAVISPSLDNFSPQQAASTVALMQRVANACGSPSAIQTDLIQKAGKILGRTSEPKGKWG